MAASAVGDDVLPQALHAPYPAIVVRRPAERVLAHFRMGQDEKRLIAHGGQDVRGNRTGFERALEKEILRAGEIQHRRAHTLGTQRRHADAMRTVSDRKPLEKRKPGSLGGSIGRGTDVIQQTGRRDGAEDVSLTALEHLGQHRARSVHVGHDVDFPALLPSRVWRLGTAAEGDAGVRAIDVDAAETVSGLADELSDLGFDGDVHGHCDTTHRRRHCCRPVGVQIGDHDTGRTRSREGATEGCADATPAPGDDGDAPRNLHWPYCTAALGPSARSVGYPDVADLRRNRVLVRDSHFIDGRWFASSDDRAIAVENPATETVIAHVPDGNATDADRAVRAAGNAFPAWAATPAAERARLIGALHAGLLARQSEVAQTITSEMGAPARMAMAVQTGLPLQVLSSYIDLAGVVDETEKVGNSLVLHEPVGVVAAITPWNYPLHQSIAKIAPALLAGCTVVHKPSEIAPLSAYIIAEIVESIGLPAGVYNLVCGTGEMVGEALASHPAVDMVSFTGSTGAGRRVSAAAAATVKRVALELGGKSANVILDDGDIGAAVKVGVANCWLNSGQTCTAWTRMLVAAPRYDEVVDTAASIAATYTVGDPTDPLTRLGPLVSATQRDRVNGYIERGVRDGARLVAGGRSGAGLPDRGYYVAPTVFADVDPDSAIAQEEIFGPVLSIIRCEDEDDAVRIANGTQYGLAGAVWSADREHAIAVARRMRTGQVDINGARFNPSAPFGGYKQSGHGRELGRYGLEEFMVVKSIQLP